MTDILVVRNLDAGYAESQVLFGLDLRIGKGEVVTLLGRNGMGKTTTVKAIAGLLKAQTGSIALGGVATVPWRARAAEQSLIGKMLDFRAARQAGTVAFSAAQTTPQNAFRVPLGINTVVQALMIAKARA